MYDLLSLDLHEEKKTYLKVFYCWSKPLHLVFMPAAQIRQVSQGSVVRWEGVVHKQSPSADVVVFQLCIVLVVELGRVGGAPLTAILVTQVDDRGACSRFRHVGERLQTDSETQGERQNKRI